MTYRHRPLTPEEVLYLHPKPTWDSIRMTGREAQKTSPTYQPWADDVMALGYYAGFGLLDPTNIADVPFWTAKGFSLGAAVSFTGARALIGSAVIGWALDPADRREGGYMQSQDYIDRKSSVQDWWAWVTNPFTPTKSMFF